MVKATVFVTKYALTRGIYATTTLFDEDGYSQVSGGRFLRPSDYAMTPEGAKMQAEEMRASKIAALTRQLAKLRGMRFEVHGE